MASTSGSTARRRGLVPPTSARRSAAEVVEGIVTALGGRFSTEADIDVDGGDLEVERWFLTATLFGTRISSAIAVRTYRVLHEAGVSTVSDAGRRTWDELVELLDAGGYARYDFRTARRLLDLAAAIESTHPEGIAVMGRRATDRGTLERDLQALPGWGAVTCSAFLRELRGVWHAARPPVDRRADEAARHLRLVGPDNTLSAELLEDLSSGAGHDFRDVEAALVRLSLGHHRAFGDCPGGGDCEYLLNRPPSPNSAS